MSSTPSNRNRSELELLFKIHMQHGFPLIGNPLLKGEGNPDLEALHDIHDDLVLLDADVAAVVDTLLIGVKPPDEVIHHPGFREEPDLENRINELIARFSPESPIGRGARIYAIKYDELKKLIHAAQAFVSSRND